MNMKPNYTQVLPDGRKTKHITPTIEAQQRKCMDDDHASLRCSSSKEESFNSVSEHYYMSTPKHEEGQMPIAPSLHDSTNDVEYRDHNNHMNHGRERRTNKRKSDHDDKRGETPPKREIIPAPSGHACTKQSRTGFLQAPSLLRPPIDRRYYTRIRPKQQVMRDNKIFRPMSIVSGRDENDSSDLKCFDKDSSLYQEITAKSHHAKRVKQCQKAPKRWEENRVPKNDHKRDITINERRVRWGSETSNQIEQTAVASPPLEVRRPMITFAPEQEPSLERTNIQCKNSSQILQSIARVQMLPFEFMPVDNATGSSVPVKQNPILALFKFVTDLAIKLLVVVIRVWSAEEPISGTIEVPLMLRSTRTNKSKSAKAPKNSFRTKPPTRQRKVENPKDLVHVVPSSLFDLQPGVWKCNRCGFKNPADTLSCDACLTINANRHLDAVKMKVKDVPESSPSAMSCDSHTCDDGEKSKCNSFDGIDVEEDPLIERRSTSPVAQNESTKRSDHVMPASPERIKRTMASKKRIGVMDTLIESGDTSSSESTIHEQWSEMKVLSKKRTPAFDHDEGPSKRFEVDEQNHQQHEDDMDISPNKDTPVIQI